MPVSAQLFVLKLHITPWLHPTLLQTHIPPAAAPPDDLHACSKASPEGSRHCSVETGHCSGEVGHCSGEMGHAPVSVLHITPASQSLPAQVHILPVASPPE